MNYKIVLVYLFKFLISLLCIVALICHIAQLVLLEDPKWSTYTPYLLYFIGPGLSIISILSTILMYCCTKPPLWFDRLISLINFCFTLGFILYISLQPERIPWTEDNLISANKKGFATYCSDFTNNTTLFIRCWAINGSWLSMVLYEFCWFMLSICLFLLKRSEVIVDDYDVHDFKNDVPMVNLSNEETLNFSGFSQDTLSYPSVHNNKNQKLISEY